MSFVEGIRVFKPNEKAPDFIKGNFVINIKDFIKDAEKNAGDNFQARFVMKESKKGNYYLQWDDYVSNKQKDEDVPF
ncbi:MAG TPA: hypothetical protein DHM42_09820 [Clostridiales bacterium]|nr:hypothetical protein [Clostridiales bacterium]